MADFLFSLLWLSIAGTLLGLFIMCVKKAFGRRIGKRFYYLLWLLVLMRLCLPFGGVTYSGSATEHGSAAGFINSWREAGGPLPAENEQVPVQAVQGGTAPAYEGVGEGEATALVENMQEVNYKNSFSLRKAVSSEKLWFVIWVVGAAASLIWFVSGYLILCQSLKKSAAEPTEEMRKVFLRLYGGRKLRLIASCDAATPMLMGLFRPAIVVPVGIFSEKDTGNILRHELSHYRRMDILFKWFSMFVMCAHWFNPLMMVFRSEIAKACELACDEDVVSRLDAEARRRYAETLVTLSGTQRIPAGVLATTMGAEKREMKGRILSIISYKKASAVTAVGAVLLALLLCACAAATGVPKKGGVSETDNTIADIGTNDGGDSTLGEESLSDEELWWFQTEFFGNGDEINIRNLFILPEYEAAADIDLYEVFYLSGNTAISESEKTALQVQEGWDVLPDCAGYKLTPREMDDLLMANTGLTLAETNKTGIDKFIYLSGHDAYYQFHGDTNYIIPKIESGIKDQSGDVWLTYTVNLWYSSERTVHLKPAGDSYLFVSNTENPGTGLAVLTNELTYDPIYDVLSVRIPSLYSPLDWDIRFEGWQEAEGGSYKIRPIHDVTEWADYKYYAFGNVSKYTSLTMTASLPDKITGERQYAEVDILAWLNENEWFENLTQDDLGWQNTAQGSISGIDFIQKSITFTSVYYSPYNEITVYLPDGMELEAELQEFITVTYTGSPSYLFDNDMEVVSYIISAEQVQDIKVETGIEIHRDER